MKMVDRLKNVTRLFLDTAPVVYYIEENEAYVNRVDVIFEKIDNGVLLAVASPITLAECLVIPYRNKNIELCRLFTELLTMNHSVIFSGIDQTVATRAAELRACYNFTLSDSFQIAVAILSGCDAFLTNDLALKHVTEIDAIVLNEMDVG